MKLCYVGKDGGPESTVWGFWLIEIKKLFSVALLCFENGSREAFHTHAFNSVSWVLTLRGPWVKHWWEYWPKQGKFVLLSNGRKIEEIQKCRS